MATITKSTLDELLKRLYAGWEIEDLVNLTYPVLGQCFAKGSAQLGGSGFYFPVRTSAAEGHGFIAEDGYLPTPLQSTVRQAVANPTVQAGAVQLSGLSMAVSSGNAAAFAEAFDENVNSTIEAMMAYREGAAFRAGDGVVAVFNGDPSTSGQLTFDDVSFLRPGMVVRVYDTSTAGTTETWYGDYTVGEVVWENRTADLGTIDASIGDNDEVYLDIRGGQSSGEQTTGTAPSDHELLGLEASLLNSGTYLGISRSTYPNWQAQSLTASSLLDEDIVLRARARITQETGIGLAGMGAFKLLCHPTQANALFKLSLSRVHFSGTSGINLLNSEEVKLGNIGVITSYLCPDDKAYLGDWRYSKTVYTPGGELHIDTEYNGSALKWVANKDVGIVFAKCYSQLIVTRPPAFCRISSITQATR
jgi:hypothetical protein